MAFPDDELGIRAAIQAGGTWVDITGDVLTADPITHTRGISSQGTSADPASAPMKINNTGGKYSPRNPVSPYYGLIGRNTPVRLWLPGGAHFLDLDGTPGNIISTPDTAALDITGDLDLRWDGEANWYGPGAQTLIGKWEPAGNQKAYMLRLEDGRLVLHQTTDGITGGRFDRALPALPRRAALRATLDIDNGAGQREARFYWATTLAGPWNEFAAPFTTSGTTATFASTAPLTIAPTDLTVAVPRYPVAGRVYAAEVRSGIGGTIVANPNFEARPLGAASFADSAGRTWTYSGTAAVADRQDVFVGEISSWPQRWVPSGELVWTPVEASGVLRRYSQGQKALDSTLRRRIPSGSPVAYWPLEEDRDATHAYSPIKGVAPASVTGIEFGSLNTLASSAPLPRLTAAGTLSAPIPDTMPSGIWQVEFVYTADDKVPTDHAELLTLSSPNGTVRRWVVTMKSGSGRLTGYDASGDQVVLAAIAVGADVFHGWNRLRVWASDQGDGTVMCRISWQDVGGDSGGLTKIFTGSAGRLSFVTANWGSLTEGWGFGHLTVLPTANNNTLLTGSDAAFTGETAWDRMRRLAGEENLPIARIAGALTPERVGPQRSDTLLALLQAAADADGGMLLEDRLRPGLVYRDRSSLYQQEPALTLTYGAPGLAPPLEPVDDDQSTRNDRTIVRDGGSSARAVLESGPLSVQAPPLGIGLYDDSQTLSLSDDTQTEPIAYWQLHLGTYDGARYPSVRLLLHRAPQLIPAVLAMREGDFLRLKALPPWVAYGDVDLIVTGWTETLRPRAWERTFACQPAGPWMTAKANTIREDFEDTAYALTLTAGGTLPWTRTQTRYNSGTWSLRSGAITNNQTSDVAVTLPAGARTFSFWYRVSSEQSGPGFEGDRLLVLVDGVQVLRAQGEVGWTQVTVDVSGKSAITFRYAKDNSSSSGEDAAFIDDLRVVLSTYAAAKADTDGGSTLAADLTATSTTMVVASTGLRWTTDPGEMPVPLQIGGEEVTATAITPAVSDAFGRTVSSGWGTADIGGAWTTAGGVATDFSVAAGVAQHVMSTANSVRLTAITGPTQDASVYVEMRFPQLSTGASQSGGLMVRYSNTSNQYQARVIASTTQVITLSLRRRVAAVETELVLYTSPIVHTTGAWYAVRLEALGSTVRARIWPAGTPEPSAWHASAADTAVPAGTGAGMRGFTSTGSTNVSPPVQYRSFAVQGPQLMTVVRSVNGVVKAHTVGEAVSLARPAITSL